jgi:dihydroflavonol-4-reductase
MKVLVIGGNGFIGSNVVRALLANGHGVRCTLRKTSKTERIDGLAFERAEADVTDLASIKAALAGCDAVVHLASPSSWNDINSPALEATVQTGTANVLEAAKAAQAKVVFCSSSMAVNASPEPVVFDERTPFDLFGLNFRYCESKHAAEEMCLKAAKDGVHVVIVNPGEVYGPEDTAFITAGNLVDFAKSSPVLVCKGGSAVVFVEDVALGIVRALEKGRSGERYILAGENLTIRQIAETTLRLLGLKRSVLTIPNPIIRAVTSVASALHLPLPFNAAVVPFATRFWFMNNEKATRELGMKFRPAEQTLGPTLEWLKKAGHIKVQA